MSRVDSKAALDGHSWLMAVRMSPYQRNNETISDVRLSIVSFCRPTLCILAHNFDQWRTVSKIILAICTGSTLGYMRSHSIIPA